VQILSSRSTTHDETLVYFVNKFDGEIRLSPDNRIRDPRKLNWEKWSMFEAKTAREKDSVSARMAEQLWRRKKSMEIERLMREQEARNMMRNSAKLRQARSPSKLDYDLNQRVLDKIDADEDKFYRLLCEEFDPSKRTSGLEIEWSSTPTSYWGRRGEKAAGLGNG
jgi:hypothetical protein